MVKKPVSKSAKLIQGISPIFCAECKMSCQPLSSDAERVILKHSGPTDCVNHEKVWSIPHAFVTAQEI